MKGSRWFIVFIVAFLFIMFAIEYHLPYRILVEADFLVNLYEDDSSRSAAEQAYDKIFRTNTGKNLLKIMFLIP